jgi:HD-GYP domain-containing protein (c-di-GMP phosphodiesterase class II)
MFVEELEVSSSQSSIQARRFVISSHADVERLMSSHVLSLVIDTKKGRDVDADGLSPGVFDRPSFEAELASKFSAEQISRARNTLDETRPNISNLHAQVRAHQTFHLDVANEAVEQVVTDAMSNANALISMAKLKDKDEATFLHSLSVSALMVTFGRSLKLDEGTIRFLGLGGLVHDLGKTALSVDLLRKPGQLTAEEFALIRTHPERGYEMAAQIVDMPKAVLDICLYHHEKFDGSGYPKQLAGHSIPLLARLAAICDVYDALTTVRPYKRSMSQAEAVDMMLRSQGHFDPELLKIFVSKMIVGGIIN